MQSSNSNLFVKNNAGLPNITGVKTLAGPSQFSMSGCFVSSTYLPGTGVKWGPGIDLYDIGFNANGSNAIYGTSKEVMPNSYNSPVAIYLGMTN